MTNQRILASEEMVGYGHATKADTLNRFMMVEHNEDGTHAAASDSGAGMVELATNAETLTGTATDRAITPANLAAKLTAAAYISSVEEANLGAACVVQSKLKTSTGEVSTSSLTIVNLTLPGGTYGFYPQIKMTDTLSGGWQASLLGDGTATFAGWAAYVTSISLVCANALRSIYAQQRYVTSSGEVFWVFALRDYETGLIISTSQSPDHPCFGNGAKPLVVPHPFLDVIYNAKKGFYEFDGRRVDILVVNPEQGLVEELKQQGIKPFEDERDKSLLEVINTELNIVDNPKLDWPLDLVTVGVRGDIGMPGEKSDIIKKQIPKMSGFLTAEFKVK